MLPCCPECNESTRKLISCAVLMPSGKIKLNMYISCFLSFLLSIVIVSI